MANELVIHYPTGATLYVLLSDATGKVYNGSTFEAPASANWATYGIAMTEAATATGIYRADMPAVAAGAYGWVVRKQAGASPAVSDVTVGAGSIRWTGTAEEAVPAVVANPTGGTITTVTNLTNAPTAGDLTATMKTSVTAAVPAVAAIADATLDAALAGHLTAGSAGAALSAAAVAGDPWLVDLPGDYDAGTAGAIMGGLLAALANTGATVTVISAVSGGNITVYANDTWRFTVTDATLSLSGYEALALVVKRTARQDDNEAILYLRSDAAGLVRIDGAAPASAANGTLTSTATSFTALVAIAETVGIAAGKYGWWLKGFDATPTPNEGLTLAVGSFTVADPGLQAIA